MAHIIRTSSGNTTFVKKITVGVPARIPQVLTDITNLQGIDTTGEKQNDILIYDSASGNWIPQDSATIVNLTLTGNLTVEGETTTLNTTVLDVEDKNITLAKGITNANDATGAGISVDFEGASLTFDNTDQSWNFNRNLNVTGRGTFTGNLLPAADSTYDLGDSSTKWKDLYLSGSTIHLGGLDIKDLAGDFSVTDSVGSAVNFDLAGSVSQIRGFFSSSGDLSYDSSTGIFSFDVEDIYTTANFESDLGAAIDGGTGITYDSSTDTISITNTGVIAGEYGSETQVPIITVNAQGQIDSIGEVLVAGVTGLIYDSSSGLLTITTADGNSFTDSVNLNPFTTSELVEGTNLYYTTARADSDAKNAVSATDAGGDGSFSYNPGTGVFTYTGPSASEVRSHFSAQGDLSYDSTTGVFQFDVEDVYTKANFDSDFNVALDEAALGGTGLTFDSSTNTLNITNTGVTAATYGSASQIPVFTVNAQGQLDSAGSVAVAGVTGLTYDSSTGALTISTADGSTFTDSINLNPFSTTDLSEGNNLYYTTARADSDAKNAISLTFTGGDGAASYTPATGVISVTGPSAAEVRAHLSGGTGVTYNSGTGVITTTDGEIVHDNLSGFVANEHIDHTSVSITAGKGLVGGGTIASTRTIDIDSANVRGMFSGGTGVTYTSGTGQIAIGQSVGTTDDVTFGQVTGDSFSVGEIAFQTDFHDSHIPFEEGALWYDPHHKNLNYYTDFDHPIEIGMQIVERVYNNNAYTINKGQPLYYSGNRTDEAGQESPTVALANATSSTKYNVQGLSAEDIPPNQYGQIVVAGVIDGFDTSGLTAGLNFFAGLTDGSVQNAPPTYPNYPMCLGWVIKSDATNGKVIINQQNHSVNTFRVQGDTHIGDDLVVDGNLTVNGTQTITSTENVSIGGNIQYLNAGDTIGENGTSFVGSGLDDAFYSGHYSGDSSSKSFFVKIDATGTPDTFEWGFDSSVGTQATGVAITGEAQLLDSDAGISIDFGATTGHTVGDKWVGTATALNTDTGLFSNKNEGDAGNGYTHVGLYWDASQDEWTFVGQYDSEPEAPINRSAASFAYGDVRGKDFYGTNFTGALVGNADTSTEATNVTVSANNSADETVYLTFVDGATGTQGIETDTGLSYNPSTGLITSTAFSGSGASLTSLNASNISSGTISDDRLPASITSDITGNAATATALATGRTIDVTGVTATGQSFDGTGDINIEVTAVPASLFTGTIDSARIPSLAPDDIHGTFATGQIPSLATSKITSGVFDSARIPFIPGGDADTLNNQSPSYYLNYNNFTNTPTNVSTFTNDANYLDSNTVTGVIDASYVQSNQITYNTSDFTDSAGVSAIITADVDKAFVDALNVDADTLDGIDGASFLRSNADDTYSGGQLSIRSNSSNGHFVGLGLKYDGGWRFTNDSSMGMALRNNATGGYWHMYIADSAGTADGFVGNGLQEYRFGGTDGEYIKIGGNTVWHAGNDGSGSTLDADLLDGVEGSSFLRSDAADTKTSGNLTFNDNVEAVFGTGTDLRIYHNGSNSFIREQGTGDLVIQATDIQLQTGGGAKFLEGTATGTVDLYHDNTLKVKTDSDGMRVAGIVNQPSGIILEDPSNTAYGGHISFYDGTSTEHFTNGDVVIGGRNNTARKKNIVLDRDTDTVRFPGDVQFDSSGGILFDVSDQSFKFRDNHKAIFGIGSDLQIYHDGSNSHITDQGTGDLTLSGSNNIILKSAPSGEYMAIFRHNSNVELRHNNITKFETTTTGATITGEVVADSATINGGPIYFDSDGNTSRLKLSQVIQQGSGSLNIQNDNGTVYIGAENATYAHIRTDRSLFYIADTVEFGTNEIRSYNGDFQIKRDDNDTNKIVISDSDVQFHNGVLRIDPVPEPSITANKLYNVAGTLFWNGTDVTSGGGTDSSTVSAIITADVDQAFVNALNVDADTLDGINGASFLRSDAADTKTSGNLTFNDGVEANFGTGSDLRIFHSSPNSIIRENNGNPIYIQTDGTIHLTKNNASETLAKFISDGAVELYHNNSKKIETTSDGVTVTGLLSATTKSFDIEHPTKEGMRLRYGSLEGPENGVYVRGRLKGNNTIELPDYWTGLVDEDTITVNLTPIGKHQEIYVEDIDDNKVIIGGEDINCFYTVYGERKDVDQLVVEY